MSIFNDFDEGITRAIPSFLFPEKEVNYYNGNIPEFKESLLDKNFKSRYSKFITNKLSIKENLDAIEELVIEKFQENDITSISESKGKIYIKINEGFYLYDMVWIDDFISLEDSYEKACIAEAMASIPHENDQILDYLKSMSEDGDLNETDDIYDVDDELEIFEEIDNFLSLKKRFFEKENFKNIYTKEILQHCYKNKKFLDKCFFKLQQEESSINIGSKYIIKYKNTSFEPREDYHNIENFLHSHGLLVREEIDFRLTLDSNLEIEEKDLIGYGDKVFNFNETLNKLLIKWTDYQAQCLNQKD